MPFSPTSAHSRACKPIVSSSVGTQPKLVQLAHGVRLKVDADAERLQIRDGFEHQTGHADLLQGEGDAEAADSATGDEYGQVGHQNSLSRAFSADENPRLPGAAQDPSVVVV